MAVGEPVRKLRLVKGETVVCPEFRCARIIASVRRNVLEGETLGTEHFEDALGIRISTFGICPKCQALWSVGGLVNILKRGWV
jgi:hypothetical protein